MTTMVLKMLGGDARGALNDFAPDVVQVDQPMRGRKCKKLANASGLQLQKTINIRTAILSQTGYSRARPARGTRGPHKVCDNLH